VILSDRSIKEAVANGRLGIDPFDLDLVQPSSVDVRLDSKFLVFRNTKRAYIDVKQPADDLMEMIEVGAEEPMFLHPHEFVLGSTIERVRMPNDLVARLEGRSSLGRLGVVIHSSLPYDETVLFLDRNGVLEQRRIGELVEGRIRGKVVGFDRETFEVSFHEVTNFFKELPDKVYEVRLKSGRRVRVTAGHNLFALDAAGRLTKTPTGALVSGSRVAIPNWIPDAADTAPEIRVLNLLPSDVQQKLLCYGPTVDCALELHDADVRRLLRLADLSVSYYVRKRCLPLPVLIALHGAVPEFSDADHFTYGRGNSWLPAVIHLDRDVARLFGLGSITCCSMLLSAVFSGLGMGADAPTKRLPTGALGWPADLLESLLEGLLDGDGSRRRERDCVWTTSTELPSQVLLAATRLGKRAVTQTHAARPRCLPSHVVSIATSLHSVEKRLRALHVATVERPYKTYVYVPAQGPDPLQRLGRLVNGGLQWDEVVEVVDTGRFEPVYDLEVRGSHAHVENFLAGSGGVFVSNTAGFIDPEFEGHVTLEISNLANLPIALYPGMRIGQISFSLMTTPADRPYGAARGSKYIGQQLPTASRLYLDFRTRD
jgi:deoxycytidine triphosphate deaminase